MLVGDDLLLPRDLLAERLGLKPAGLWAYEALRIEDAPPRLGFETDHKTIPHEVGWIGSALHLSKGCYRGQETVARVHNLGHPPRRLVFLHLDGSVDPLPKHGTPVVLDDGEVGFVGSSARHYELGPIALAVVKRTVPVDATLLAGGWPRPRRSSCRRTPGRNVQIDPALRAASADDPGPPGIVRGTRDLGLWDRVRNAGSRIRIVRGTRDRRA